MSAPLLPFNRPCLAGRELEYVADAVRTGHSAGDGRYTKCCQQLLEEELKVHKALLTTSCTDALEMSALLLDLEPGDEVIVPSFTFVSTANAFALHGARPVFADIRPDTLNIDEEAVARIAGLRKRARAIVAVHYAGVGCEMRALLETAAEHGLTLIEDNAHGLFGAYQGRPLGSLGDMATLSFHETKNFICGEGGALLLNRPELVERAEIIREKGTNRKRFFRGEVDKYTWVDIGSSYLPSDLLAAFLFAQFEARSEILAKRRNVWERYARGLGDWARQHAVALPRVPAGRQPSYHMFHLVMPSPGSRDALIGHLRDRGIMAVFHYQPLHESPAGRRLGFTPLPCPVAESVSARLVRLPFWNDLSEPEMDRILGAVLEFRP